MKKITPKTTELKGAVSSIKDSVSDNKNVEGLPFSKQNYVLMLIGLGLIALGFIIMTQDKEEFGFGFLGITLGPAIAFIGFIFEFYAIFKKK
ncbi:DUF3098 domain-containing protein [Emticicia sp. 17c]|uniref:DUF3098 domain-containing protein n=1 Tax=Emticicia sp. 17c TaxID=3127704 RepID=UPI00301D0D7A